MLKRWLLHALEKGEKQKNREEEGENGEGKRRREGMRFV